jgi:formylglycine-generating enzyme required for sulfatase activity
VGNDKAEMVLVPAGEFSMGSDGDEIDRLLKNWTNVKRETFNDEIPRHRVYLDAFYIDKHEVTNARFQQFVQATGHRTQAEREGSGDVYTGQKWEQVNGANWRAPRGPGSSIASLEQHPVVQVSQEDAKAYCSWAGKRLPTEAEWEKAARGTDGQIYPWGNQFDGKRANFCDTNCDLNWKDNAANDGYRYTAPVGSYEGGKSPYGAYDMAGNVCGWLTGTVKTTIETVLHGIHRDRGREIRPSCAAAGGTIARSPCARPSAAGTRPRLGAPTSGSGAPRLCNP